MSPQSLVARLKEVWPDVDIRSYKTVRFDPNVVEIVTNDGLHFYFKAIGRDWIISSYMIRL